MNTRRSFLLRLVTLLTDAPCRRCKGSGVITWSYYRWSIKHTVTDKCPRCGGSGREDDLFRSPSAAGIFGA